MAKLSLVGVLLFSPVLAAQEDEGVSRLEQGKALTFNRFKGNCLACHYVEGADLTGNYGPPLIAMKIRYPDLDVLRAQIWDATVNSPNTIMPPFGKHKILSDKELDKVVEFIHTL